MVEGGGDVHGQDEDDEETQEPHEESCHGYQRILPPDIPVFPEEVDGEEEGEEGLQEQDDGSAHSRHSFLCRHIPPTERLFESKCSN